MPLYPFTCEACDHAFESLSLAAKSAAPTCPSCESPNVVRGFGVPARLAPAATNCRGDGPPCALPQCGRRNL